MKAGLTIIDTMKVLVVDDNEDNLDLMCQMLEDECAVITAIGGYECLEKATDERPDLILLDVNMPEMDGYETMQRLHLDEACKSIPVIFVSAYYTESSMIVKGLEKGAFDYLTKPVDEDILLAKVGVVRRIKQAEDEVLQQKNELQIINSKLKSADKLKSIFLASMSHELRTPLNSIIGFTGLMLMQVAGKINDAQEEQLRRVKRNAEHLLELINDVLDISKIEAGKIDLNVTKFDIAALVNEMVKSMVPEIHAKGLKFDVILPESSVMIESDSRRIRQILMNFMSNALKFTDHGFIHVELNTQNPQQIVVSIKDTGAGIQQDSMAKLFEPFQQINMDYTRDYKGSGLGLYLCEKLSQMIGGGIQVDSQYGEGSMFSLVLPVSTE